jgi:undecaprenol kinase
MSQLHWRGAMKNRPFHERLVFALNGLAAAWRRENSIRTQAAVAALAVAALVVLRPPIVWWAVVTLTIAFVLAIELMNSAFEGLVDHLHPDRHPEIRTIKDMAAGGVLLASVGALATAGLLLLAALWR